TVMLFGKLANIGDDISAEFIVDPSVFKKIVTGEDIDAEYKGRDKFSFKPYAKLYFSANKISRIGKGGEFASIKRRLIIIPFDRHFSKDDPDFDPYIGEKLKTQSAMEYLIVLGVQGLKRILENKGFSTSQKTQNAIEEYDRDNNPVLAFIRECKEEERKIENEPVALVYQWYSKFCFENGLEKEKMVKSAFSKSLLSHLPELKVERIGKERTSVYVQKP
ncbi:MAG: DNA primase, partial [Clostridiales bacterium]|nr:DNA primase [Clostridiales bacterium]